jgi:hypothetical protein
MTPTPTSPTVLSIAPASGPASGGTSVRISGSNFATGASVTIGGVAATNIVVESAASIAATTSAHAAGAADVVVTVSGRSGSLPAAFAYQASNPPAISGITVRGAAPNQPASFADLGEEVTVSATVQDSDTAADQLIYQWSAPGGTFSGMGASVKWRAPSSAGTVKLTLVVSDGTPVTGTVDVSVHDSVKEVGDLARLFLLDFSDSNKSADVVMRNFSTSSRCVRERDAEFSQVSDNRVNYKIDSYNVGSATVNFSFGGAPCSYAPRPGDACAAVPTVWNSTRLKDVDGGKKGEPAVAQGTDYVTAVYEQTQWLLCASYFKGVGTVGVHFIR